MKKSKVPLLFLSIAKAPWNTVICGFQGAFALAGAEGIEPSTRGFGDRCSTGWALPLYFVFGCLDHSAAKRKVPFRRRFWWSIGDLNPWPQHCQCCALPTALIPRIWLHNAFFRNISAVCALYSTMNFAPEKHRRRNALFGWIAERCFS